MDADRLVQDKTKYARVALGEHVTGLIDEYIENVLSSELQEYGKYRDAYKYIMQMPALAGTSAVEGDYIKNKYNAQKMMHLSNQNAEMRSTIYELRQKLTRY